MKEQDHHARREDLGLTNPLGRHKEAGRKQVAALFFKQQALKVRRLEKG